MSWEVTGELSFVNGAFGNYLSVGTPFTITLTGDTDAPMTPIPQCGPERHSAVGQVFGSSELRVGDFTYAGSGGFLERNDEEGTCGYGPLDFIFFNRGGMFGWQFVGTPPEPGLAFLYQVYVNLDPVDLDATTVGAQFGAVTSALFGNASARAGALEFNNATFTPVPEPGTLFLVGGGLLGLFRRMRRGAR